MGLDSLVPFVYLVWLGVLRLGLNEVVHVHLPKYPYINNTKNPPISHISLSLSLSLITPSLVRFSRYHCDLLKSKMRSCDCFGIVAVGVPFKASK
ncbi:hypothetical protein Scep_029627 [Stephania cephalantha]|uniref:Uncharacterized protein n=1 Tax=Stephania cephalantha TaxID=152367 RepID=A0AAP0DY35_9MAGN